MMLQRYFASFLPLVLLYGKSMGSEQIKLTSESMCYWTNTSYDRECDFKKEPKQIEEVHLRNGSSSGVVIAEVELPPKSCNYARFYVTLVVKEEYTGFRYCGEGEHSWRKYKRFRCGSDTCPDVCGKLTKFTFHHVKSGLYYLKVKAYNEGNLYHTYQSQPMEILTDYDRFWGTQIMKEVTPYIDRRMVNFHFTFTTPISEVQINVKDENTKNLKEIHMGSSEPMETKICNVTLEKNDLRHIGKITGVSCAYNAPNRSKTLEVTYPSENTCDKETRIENIPHQNCVCWRFSSFELLNIKEEKPDMNYSLLFTLLLALFVLLIGVIAVIIVISEIRRHRRKKYFHHDGISQGLSTPILPGNIEILLLYPRDCPQFMKLMKSLKIFLETTYQTQVHDCYDKYTREVLEGPQEWFQSLMIRTGLRIIVITTECAHLLQEAYFSNINGIYRQPEFHDNFFIYGLLHIKRDFSLDIYHKIYNVQISDFSNDVELKFIPTALTRYKLPDHFEKLLKDMSIIQSDVFFIEMDNKLKGPAYEDFMKSYQDLISFKTNNENYLYQMLTIHEV